LTVSSCNGVGDIGSSRKIVVVVAAAAAVAVTAVMLIGDIYDSR